MHVDMYSQSGTRFEVKRGDEYVTLVSGGDTFRWFTRDVAHIKALEDELRTLRHSLGLRRLAADVAKMRGESRDGAVSLTGESVR